MVVVKEYYKYEIEKRASLAGNVLKGIAAFSKKPALSRIGTGAAIGAIGKGITSDSNTLGGKTKDMIGGAITGGLMGGAVNPNNLATAQNWGKSVLDEVKIP